MDTTELPLTGGTYVVRITGTLTLPADATNDPGAAVVELLTDSGWDLAEGGEPPLILPADDDSEVTLAVHPDSIEVEPLRAYLNRLVPDLAFDPDDASR